MLVPSIFATGLSDDFFDGFFHDRFQGENHKPAPNIMKTDIIDAGENYQLEVELPGYHKEDLHAELMEGYLTIRATKKEEIEDKAKPNKYVRRERYTGSCKRSFFVGDDLKEGDIKATFEDGVLTLVFPKEEKRTKIQEKKFIPIA